MSAIIKCENCGEVMPFEIAMIHTCDIEDDDPLEHLSTEDYYAEMEQRKFDMEMTYGKERD